MRDSLYQKVVLSIEEKIVKGEIKLNEKLPSERELSIEYEVSRNVVREAIKILKEKGYVKVLVGKGAFVTKPNPTHITDSLERVLNISESGLEDIIEVREELELIIVQKAIEKATEKNIYVLKQCYKNMEEKRNSISEFVEEDANFHIELAKATQNDVFYVLLNSVHDLSDRILFSLTRLYPFSIDIAQQHHFGIIEAITTRDTVKGIEIVKAHMDTIRLDLKNLLEDEKLVN
ncbi:FadR/GntR family transcriptional regulator [Oceanobacillus luteolus]|uniref:FadR/GntR family transcriptional regulator n=1 Tax=Oceanobacillus luteolus TaxID=1274358 RepID=A0ABW4HNK7_9BACI